MPRPGREFSVDRHRPKRRFSQNFLVDPNMCRKIVDSVGAKTGQPVIEIGPGRGALTQLLLDRAGHVHAVELDRELYERLEVELGTDPRLTLHQGDVLRTSIRELVGNEQVTVVGNLPYHITSDLVLWVLRQHGLVRRAVMMMQREVALRLTAEPGTREAGALTLSVNYRAEADRVFDVPPSCFRPRPKVTSSVVVFRMREKPLVEPADEGHFFGVIRAAFRERRKTLVNALTTGLNLPREAVGEAVAAIGLDPRIRGERLSLEDFQKLSDALRGMEPSGPSC